MVGTQISQYTITDKLGEGGMGVVYLAEDTRLGRNVAIKFLPSETTAREEDRQRFEQEGRAAASLNHPNICTIHHFDEYEGRPFLVMEYVEGITLRERLREGPLPLEEALDYAAQVASALAEAHEAGIIHRDVKPANVMIGRKGRLKVMDFGLAKLKGSAEALTRTGSTVGTMAYMAPEQIQGREVDHRADIFALGVAFFEMLTGRRPFRGEHEAALMYSIVNEEPASLGEYLPEAPDDLVQVVDRLLEKEPAARTATAHQLVHALERIRSEDLSGLQQATASATSPPSDSGLARKDAAPSGTGSTTLIINIPSFKHSLAGTIGVIGGVLLLFGAGYFLFMPADAPEVDRSSIAVLPFESVSADPDDIQLVRGVHEDVINQLSNVEGLRVIARGSVLHYESGQRDLRRIQQDLGVATILDGSVWRIGDRIRVSTQLIDVETNENLWAGTFDRHLDDILDLRTEIAMELVDELHTSLTAGDRDRLDERPTEDPEAYTFFMRAREYHSRPSYQQEDFRAAERLYGRALELDPQFALAHANVAELHAAMYWFALDRTAARKDKAREHADRALELNPDLPEAHRAMGVYFYWGDRAYEQALEHFETARRQIPNDPGLYVAIGAVQRRLGLFDEALANFERAIELDPRNADNYYQVALQQARARNFPHAIEMIDRAIDLAPDAADLEMVRGIGFVHWLGTADTLLALSQRVADPVAYHPEWWMWANLWDNNWDAMIPAAEAIAAIYETQIWAIPREYFVGVGWEKKGEMDRAHQYYDTARGIAENLVAEHPDDPRLRSSLGNIYAALGRKEEAIRQGKMAVEFVPLEADWLDGADYKERLAHIFARVGEEDQAVDLIEHLLSIPSNLTAHRLRLEPWWDELRDHPRFEEFVADR